MTTPVRTRPPLLRRPWIGPLALITGVFLVLSLPPYLTFDPDVSRTPIREDVAGHYPVLWAHIAFGTVALVTACLQLWPRLRQRRPAVHRWSGRIYVFAGVLPSGVLALIVAALADTGISAQAANVTLAVLWLATTVAGFRMARQRRFGEHREWMIRSVALAFSIVVNRVWLVLCLAVADPSGFVGKTEMDPAVIDNAVGAATWLSWVVNLLLAEWWLQRRRRRQGSAHRRPVDAASRSAVGKTPV